MSPEELQAFKDEFVAALAPDIKIEKEYTLYYNESGTIYMCSMINHADSENYIVVDQETYKKYYLYYYKYKNYCIKNLQ